MHQNIAGLLSKSDLLVIYVQELLSKQINLDIICITEHFIMSGQEKLLHIPNYKLAACYARQNIKRGGACILVKKGIEYKDLPDIMSHSVRGIIECCAIELPSQKLTILCVYRPPKITNLHQFYENLDIILKKISKPSKKIIMCGDFNIDILKKNRISMDFEYFLMNYDLKLEINKPTRPHSKTCLDNFAHNSKQSCHSETVDFGLSDHTAQIFKMKVNKFSQIKTWKTSRRDISEENLIIFRNHLQNLSFSDIYSTEDPNVAYDNFLDIFQLLYDLCFPFKTVTLRSEKKIKWVSRGIRICSKKQRQLLWKQRLNPTSENKTTFKTYSKKFKKIIKLTQKAQNNFLIKNSKNKSKTSWQIINSTKSISEPITRIKNNNLTITDPNEIAQSFNDFFIDQISDPPLTTTKNNIKITHNPHSIFMTPAVPQDIARVIKSLKNKKSYGYDGISTNVIKFVSSIIANPLSHIINASIFAGTFPDSLKPTIVKPLHKKNSKEEIANYRPIALIPVFSKIFEKVIYESFLSFLTKFNILCDEQKGFRKNKNINMAIYDLINKIMVNVDKKIPICTIFTDMTKAFDYVNHQTLLAKLEAYGIRGNALCLIKSYLSGRLQYTEISKICVKSKREVKYLSSPRKIKYGVPQGSVLGPLLFLLYINDLPRHIPYPCVLFADDSTILIDCLNKELYEREINNSLKLIINWLHNNNLIINLNKTNIMHFYQKILPLNLKINYKEQTIDRVNVAKFLGILIDSQLTWKPQAEEVCKRLSTSAYAIFNLSKKVNVDTLMVAYHGLVVSILRFGVVFWGNCSERETIFKAQKRCIRSIFNLKVTDSCVPFFKKHKILTFPCLYILEVAIFVKTNKNLFPALNDTRMRTNAMRSKYKNILCTGRYNTALFKKNIIGMAPVIFNKLPNCIKDKPLIKFKKLLSSLLTEKCYYSVTDFLNDEL